MNQNITPGLYWNSNPDCYWERRSDASGDEAGIIANGIGYQAGTTILEIKPTDVAFYSEDCGWWNVYQGSPPVVPADGDYQINAHMSPGRWTATSGDCYWERASGFGHDPDEIIANDYSTGPTEVVDIAPTDVRFSSDGCGAWTKIG